MVETFHGDSRHCRKREHFVAGNRTPAPSVADGAAAAVGIERKPLSQDFDRVRVPPFVACDLELWLAVTLQTGYTRVVCRCILFPLFPAA